MCGASDFIMESPMSRTRSSALSRMGPDGAVVGAVVLLSSSAAGGSVASLLSSSSSCQASGGVGAAVAPGMTRSSRLGAGAGGVVMAEKACVGVLLMMLVCQLSLLAR